MFRTTLPITIFFLISILLSLGGCQPVPPSAGQQPMPQPMPLTGAAASQLGAAAISIQENPGENTVSILPVSIQTGQAADDVQPVVVSSVAAHAFSQDRSRMAFLASRSNDCSTTCLHLMDLQNWKETMAPLPLEDSFGNWFLLTEFDLQRGKLPVILNKQTESSSEVRLVDLAQAKVVAKKDLPLNVMDAAYTPDGALMVYGSQNDPKAQQSNVSVALLDGADLHLLWEQSVPEVKFAAEWEGDLNDPTQGKYLYPASAFSAENGKLYLVAADSPLLVTVDFQQRQVHTATIQPRASLLDRLMALGAEVVYAKTLNGVSKFGALSPDGRFFYVVGQELKAVQNEKGDYTTETTPLGLQVIDTQDGALVHTLKTEATGVALSLDGKTLALNTWGVGANGDLQPSFELLDTTSWEVRQRLPGIAAASRLLDGSLAWLVTEQINSYTNKLAVYRPGGAAPLSQIDGPDFGYLDWIPIP